MTAGPVLDVIFASEVTGTDALVLGCLAPGLTVVGRQAPDDPINQFVRTVQFGGEWGRVIEAPPQLGPSPRVWVVGLGDAADWSSKKIEQAAAHAVRFGLGAGAATVAIDFRGLTPCAEADGAAHLAAGAHMAAYRFDSYRTRSLAKKAASSLTLNRLVIAVSQPELARLRWQERRGAIEGLLLARDLVNEPPNVLTPQRFAQRIAELAKLGVAVELLDEDRLEELGMQALLAVGRASAQDSALAVMHWRGGPAGSAPVALIGKGVTFDSGGISLKDVEGMQDMKADMGGAAAVVGAMHALATRRAPIHVVGLVGLVENMPSGNALRPSDIVQSMSGQTIEITNTDAEGRLVLCDTIHYAPTRYQPRSIIDMATLTGVAMMALGYEHAALFANNAVLARAIEQAGERECELVWRLPLAPAYDVAIDSKFADMKNAAGRLGGAITAAQFLQRFVPRDVPWAHIDMGGMVQVPSGDFKTDDPRQPSWATGWGARLLDRLVRDHFESVGDAR